MQTQCQIQKSHHTTLLKESCLWLSRLFAVHFSDRGLKNKKQKKKTRITFNYHVRLRISDHRFKVKASLYRIRKRRTGSTYFLIKTFTASQKLSAYLQHKTKFGKVVLIHLICPTLITDSIFLIQNHLCVVYYTNNNTSTPEVLLNSFQFINDFSFRLNSRIHLVYTLFDTAYFSFGKP